MATAGSKWGIVISRDAGFCDQVVELDFLYPCEGIHLRWDYGFCITSIAATWDQAAFVLSVPRRKIADENQETLRTSAFLDHKSRRSGPTIDILHLSVTADLFHELPKPVLHCYLHH